MRFIRNLALAALAALGLMGPALAADNVAITERGSVASSYRATDLGSLIKLQHMLLAGTNGNSAWGTAGTSNAAVLSVQGIASGTSLPVSGTFWQATQPVSNAGTFAVQAAQTGTWTVQPGNTVNSTPWLVTLSGTNVVRLQDGSGNTINSTSNNLNVQCANCSGSGASAADEATMTAGTSVFGPAGGFFQTSDTANALTTGQQGMLRLTAQRAVWSNLRNASGAEMALVAAPLFVRLSDGASAITNLATNVAQINGVTPLMGNGATGTGAMRVSIASDSTGIVALPAAGTSIVGTKAAGTAAATSALIGGVYNSGGVTLTDGQQASLQLTAAGAANVNVVGATGLAQASTTSGQTGSLIMGAVTTAAPSYTTAQTSPLSLTTAGLLRVDPGTVTVTATNLSTNVAQMNGVAVTMGNGAAGTGVQRVAIASDNSAIAGAGVGATGAAVPANAVYQGMNVGGNTTGNIGCNSMAKYDASTSGSTQLVALASSQIIRVCGYEIRTGGTATNVKFVYGTGSNCATGAADITPAFQLAANDGQISRSPVYQGMATIASNALCINASAGNAVQAIVYYTQF